MDKKILPLTIQNALIREKGNTKEGNYFIKVKKLQSDRVEAHGFYKPISKLLGNE